MKDDFRKRCQVATPPDIVKLLWAVAHRARHGATFGSVIDLGAGDARFAAHGQFDSYVGVELDTKRRPATTLSAKARFVHKDAMRMRRGAHDLAIGNPPYIRHHHLEPEWREGTLTRLHKAGGPLLKSTANLFVMFLLQSLLQTHDEGLVVQLVPFEWVTRPSAVELRSYIKEKGWSVRVLRFKADIFPTVLTTASITVIDKSARNGAWMFGEIDRDGTVTEIVNPSGTKENVLPYQDRQGSSHALRGLSPGGQSIFVLTEEQRLYHSLKRGRDVMPCVTSLRSLAAERRLLDKVAFEQEYIGAGRPCWLIRSDRLKLSLELAAYLDSVGDAWKKYTTCTNRKVWWQYRNHAVPAILVSSGFVGKAPKILVNEVGAMAVGSVYGLHVPERWLPQVVVDKLRQYDFGKRVVSHSNNLKKIEIGQFNTVLKRLFG